MDRGTLLFLLVIGGGAYWFLFRKADKAKETSVPSPPTANPVAGKTQEANNDVFGQIVGLIKSGIDAFASTQNNAQGSAQRF